jgi:hypothetical protein
MRSGRLAVWSFLAALVAGAVTVFAPLGRATESRMSAAGVEVTYSHGVSLFSTNGAWVLVVVAVPIAIALAGALIPARAARTVSTVLLWAFCLVGLMSVGLFFIPAAVLMTAATVAREPHPVPTAPNPA